MATPNAENGVGSQPEYFYETNTHEFLGRLAIEARIAAGDIETQAIPIDTALRDSSVKIISQPMLTNKKITREEILESVQQLCSMLIQPDQNRRPFINESILTRAHQMGLLVASLAQIKQRFKTSGNLYKQLPDVKTIRKHPELTPAKVVRCILDFLDTYGRMPEHDELESSFGFSYDSIIARLPKGGLAWLAREVGQPSKNMSQSELKRWGMNYMLVNGYTPSQSELEVMSFTGRGPSASVIGRRFHGSLTEFRVLIESAIERWHDTRTLKSAELESAIERFNIPSHIYQDVENENDLITRYARFRLIERMVDLDTPAALKIVTADPYDVEFIEHLKKHYIATDSEFLGDLCLDLGFERDMWRKIPKNLSLDEAVQAKLNKLRGALSDEEKEQMEAAIESCVYFCKTNRIEVLQLRHVKYMKKVGILPGQRRYKRLFKTDDLLRALIRSKVRSNIKEEEELQEKLLEEIESGLKKGDIPEELFLYVKLLSGNESVANEQAANYFRKRLNSGGDTNISVPDSALFRIYDRPIPFVEKIKRYTRWKIVDYMLPSLSTAEKVIISVLDRSRGFTEEVIKKSPSLLSRADIQIAAKILGLDDLIEYTNRQYLNKMIFKKTEKK